MRNKMTVNRLYKLLGKLIDEGHGKKPVCCDKSTFSNNCEDDGHVVLEVVGVGVFGVLQGDDDGGTKYDSKGRECRRQTCVLVGGGGADVNGNVLKRY